MCCGCGNLFRFATDVRRRSRQPNAARGDGGFKMLPQLAEGKAEILQMDLCTVMLMDDSRYPAWLVLVPRRNDLVEVTDMSRELQAMMWREVGAAAKAVQRLPGVKKLNIAAIGNICSQLHVHVTGRYPGDAAWPGPCYGVGEPEPYGQQELQQLIINLRSAILKQPR